jgi:hypothetical protein
MLVRWCIFCPYDSRFSSHYTWLDQKIPGIVKKNYLKYLYKFETLVPFEVLPLRLDAAFPLKILDNVSSIGSGAGIGASSRRGSTSKGTKVSNLYKYFKYFF